MTTNDVILLGTAAFPLVSSVFVIVLAGAAAYQTGRKNYPLAILLLGWAIFCKVS